ncbi:hypothetical protein [Paractinoplanes atraurantiacus]|uniref:SPW repeat-containing protein n=1 Tax=Paractinoplanes atraurantiacus TaxID=1036182 RepID=A0A285JRF1_9ACTN|nr:hypothetical protein [Actinoplanes atraurantiacus]SNY62357.1 hypothetical protein SAMN05421748_123133 [Actinoplanes atraurantiacus]
MKMLTVFGLLVGAVGISLLWAGGVEFPVAVPPGIVILLVGAGFVAWAPWRWAPVAGVVLGAFITVGFLISGTGFDNLSGDSGALVAVGQAIQLIGVWVAAIAGVLALRRPATTGV